MANVIYKHYDQESLDNQYNNRLHVPEYADYFNRWQFLSRRTEEALPVIKDLLYGELQRERLDIYPALQPNSKTLIFIHGGYWHLLDKSVFHFVANGFHSYRVTTVFLNYPFASEASMNQIVLSCRKAIKWLYNNVAAYSGDPHQMYVVGHSAGGHLAAMLMTTDWKAFEPALSDSVLKGVCAMSGLFNLVPVHLSYLNKVLKIDIETAKSNSPLTLEPANTCPLILAVGEAETAEFNDQTDALYACWKKKGMDIQLLRLPSENHYSIADSLVDPQSSLHKAVQKLMGIN